MKINLKIILLAVMSVSCSHREGTERQREEYSGWEAYAGTKSGMRYSGNTEINTENVVRLQEVWRYSTADKDPDNRSQNQCNPVVIDDVLYGVSPRSKLFALDAATGVQRWIFDPAAEEAGLEADAASFFKVTRGVMYWQDKSHPDDRRIFYSVGEKIFSIDAETGKPVRRFGTNGFIDLSQNLDRDMDNFKPFIASTSPGVIYRNLMIVSMRVAESADAAPGHVRAYDTRNGHLKWIFHTIPHPGEKGYDTWPDPEAYQKLGGANCWAGMSLDEARGIVYIPTGSVAGDFYGGIREGQNLFANSLIALDAATGKYIWHYQVVHHDLWDRDLPANPNLVTLYLQGDTIDAVAQITKHGYVFLFDRLTGEPVFPIEEKPVPQNALPGEKPWPTQPIPVLPEPFARQVFTEDDLTERTPEAHEEMLAKFKEVKYAERFTPPSMEGSWIFPGFDGGGEWGGAAVDPETQILYVNSSELPWSLHMVEVPKTDTPGPSLQRMGEGIYDRHCAVCHGADRAGVGEAYPSLQNLPAKYDPDDVKKIVSNGRNMMPAFGQITTSEKEALMAFLFDLEDKEPGETPKEPESQSGGGILDLVPYRMTGYNRFLDSDGYPGIKPPWGTLNAVNLSTGKLLWKIPLGEFPELTEKGIAPTGTENYGGPVVTKGGLVFIAATKDSKIRAFHKETGKELWQANLPVPGYATPAVYSVGGKQYVVIACGGGKIGSPSGDEYVAFALPEQPTGK